MNRKIWLTNVITIMRYTLMSLLIMVVINAINPGNVPIQVSLFFAIFFGIMVGAYRELFDFDRISRWPLSGRFIAMLFILQILVMFALILNRMVLLGLDLTVSDRSIFELFFERRALNFYYKTWIYGVVLLFLIELEKALGPGYISDMALGRYNKPKREDRIIMFLDLIDSTKIAETSETKSSTPL